MPYSASPTLDEAQYPHILDREEETASISKSSSARDVEVESCRGKTGLTPIRRGIMRVKQLSQVCLEVPVGLGACINILALPLVSAKLEKRH